MQEYAKMRIHNIRYQTNTIRTFWGTWSASAFFVLDLFGRYCTKICESKWGYGIKNFSALDKMVSFCICSQHRVLPLPWWWFLVRMERLREAFTVLRVELMIFSWCSRGFSPIDWNLKKWILSTNSFCIRR